MRADVNTVCNNLASNPLYNPLHPCNLLKHDNKILYQRGQKYFIHNVAFVALLLCRKFI